MPNQPSPTKRAATFRLDRDLLDRAAAKSKATGRSMTDVVAEALDKFAPIMPTPPAAKR
jgi:hypothetical protein